MNQSNLADGKRFRRVKITTTKKSLEKGREKPLMLNDKIHLVRIPRILSKISDEQSGGSRVLYLPNRLGAKSSSETLITDYSNTGVDQPKTIYKADVPELNLSYLEAVELKNKTVLINQLAKKLWGDSYIDAQIDIYKGQQTILRKRNEITSEKHYGLIFKEDFRPDLYPTSPERNSLPFCSLPSSAIFQVESLLKLLKSLKFDYINQVDEASLITDAIGTNLYEKLSGLSVEQLKASPENKLSTLAFILYLIENDDDFKEEVINFVEKLDMLISETKIIPDLMSGENIICILCLIFSRNYLHETPQLRNFFGRKA
ncbi:MAG: hypothetical protein OHK0017_11190 [Patescibacteria group bacterium]